MSESYRVDPKTGALIFKKSSNSMFRELEDYIKALEKRIEILEEKLEVKSL